MPNTNDPRKFYALSWIVLLPSLWWENQPLVAIEAMINSIPVIGSDLGGIPEVLGRSGFVLPLPERLTPTSHVVPEAVSPRGHGRLCPIALRGTLTWARPLFGDPRMRHRHPKKHVEDAIQYAESRGWRIETSNGHDWGIAYCPEHSRDGCKFGIHSTPRVEENHARRFRNAVDKCPHGREG